MIGRPGILALRVASQHAHAARTALPAPDEPVAFAAGPGPNGSRGSAFEPCPEQDPTRRAWTPDDAVGISILGFGRYEGWSLGQLVTQDRNYLEWLLRSSGGRQYHAEIERLLESH
jgi:hypothetical protein